MRNAKSRLLILLCSLLTVGIGLATADFQINVGPQDYFGTLNLNKLILRKGQNPGYTGIVIDGDSYSIKINENGNAGYGEIRVENVCDRNGNCKPVSQLSTGNSIIISGASNQNYICTKKDNNTLECSGIKLGTSNSTNFTNGGYCTYSSTNGLTCSASSGATEISGNNGKICLKSGNSLNCNTVMLGTGANDFTGNKYCVYSGNKIVCNANGGTAGVTIGNIGEGKNKYCVYNSPNTIDCNASGGSAGASHWEDTPEENNITPKNNKNISFSQTDAAIYHSGSLTIDRGGTFTSPTSQITFDGKGLRIGNTNYTGVGMGINGGMVVIGSTLNSYQNKITIYASGATATNTSNYEILGSKRLLIGTYNNGFIYFDDNKRVGINTTSLNSNNSTLTVNGGIQIGSACTNRTCDENNVGTLIYYETGNAGWLAFCRRKNANDFGRYKVSSSAVTNSGDLNIDTCNSIEPINPSLYQTSMGYANLAQPSI